MCTLNYEKSDNPEGYASSEPHIRGSDYPLTTFRPIGAVAYEVIVATALKFSEAETITEKNMQALHPE